MTLKNLKAGQAKPETQKEVVFKYMEKVVNLLGKIEEQWEKSKDESSLGLMAYFLSKAIKRHNHVLITLKDQWTTISTLQGIPFPQFEQQKQIDDQMGQWLSLLIQHGYEFTDDGQYTRITMKRTATPIQQATDQKSVV